VIKIYLFHLLCHCCDWVHHVCYVCFVLFKLCLITFDWLIDWLVFYVPLKNIWLIWRRHHYRWRASKFRPMLGAQGLWAGRDLYCATPTVTRGLGFSSLIRRTAPISRLLRLAWVCGESILTRILRGVITFQWNKEKHLAHTYMKHWSRLYALYMCVLNVSLYSIVDYISSFNLLFGKYYAYKLHVGPKPLLSLCVIVSTICWL
jgi:hypothetical protein